MWNCPGGHCPKGQYNHRLFRFASDTKRSDIAVIVEAHQPACASLLHVSDEVHVEIVKPFTLAPLLDELASAKLLTLEETPDAKGDQQPKPRTRRSRLDHDAVGLCWRSIIDRVARRERRKQAEAILETIRRYPSLGFRRRGMDPQRSEVMALFNPP